MKAKSILGALPILAKLLANQCNVKLILNSRQTKTENGEIHLPSLPIESEPLSALAFGYIVREASRIRNKCDVPDLGTGLKAALLQRINDVWVELRAQRQFPGARRTLSEMLPYLIENGVYIKVTKETHPAIAFVEFVTVYLRTKLLQQWQLQVFADQATQQLRFLVPTSLFVKICSTLDKVKSSDSFEDNQRIAADLIDLLLSYAVDSQPSDSGQSTGTDDQSNSTDQGTSDPKSGGKESEGDGSAASDQQTDEEGGSPSSTRADKDAQGAKFEGDCADETGDAGKDGEFPANADSSAKSDQRSDDSSAHQGQDNDSTSRDDGSSQSKADGADHVEESSKSASSNQAGDEQDRKRLSRQQLDRMLDESVPLLSESERIARLIDTQNQSSESKVLKIANEVEARSDNSGDALIDVTRQATGAIRTKIQLLLESQAHRKRYFAKSGEIVPKHVWKVKTGNVRVFEKLEEKRALNTSVLFCVDCSDSMSSPLRSSNDPRDYDSQIPRINLAVQSVLAMTMALDGMRHVNSAAISFPSITKASKTGNDISVLTDFDESARRTADRYASLDAIGSTPLAEAVMWSTYKLMSEKTERRILFIITDGQPSHLLNAMEALKFAEQAQIEVLGIGIGLDIKHVVPNSQAIHDLNQMPKVMFDVLEQKLKQLAA